MRKEPLPYRPEMPFLRHPTEPLDFATGVAPERARRIAAALAQHVLPLLVQRDGRLEPLASGALYWWRGQLALLTCRHLFESGVTMGDLALPLADGRPLALAALRPRLLEHPLHDVAVIALNACAARERLLRCWPALPLADAHDSGPPCAGDLFVVAGYPYAQMRRHDGALHARPVVFFSRPADTPAPPRLHYARLAQRIDGLAVHTPALDGVSGATLWAVRDEGSACVLHPAGVQCAFKHDAYARGEPFAAARDLLARLATH
ncbi:MAG: hypothetical protein ACK5TK_02585 [Betaproteobacteria bacterium]